MAARFASINEKDERPMPRHCILSSFWLKNVMLVLMLLDHIYMFLFPSELLFAHYAARVVAPVFAFLMAQGMIHTRDRRRYILRLFIAGGIMAAGNFIIFSATGIVIPNNIFFSLAVGAALIFCIDKSKGTPLWAVCATGLVIASFYCEGQYLVPAMALIFYYLNKRRAIMYTVFAAFVCAIHAASYIASGTLHPQFWMICAVFPIMLYNGALGRSGKAAKYFFYVFYPAHIWAIVLIKFFYF